jgi:polar amino acid transport system ATP-binding protein
MKAMETQPNEIIKLVDVHKKFGQTPVLQGISLSVRDGSAVCVIGPSGSGKSTLLRCINGLTRVDSGRIRVNGMDVTAIRTEKDAIALRKTVAMVFQQYNLFPHKTVLENVCMAPEHVLGEAPESVRARAKELLDRVGLDSKLDSYPGELSGGQQQRVAIARGLAMHPRVMLFDEITAALDPESVNGVLDIVRELSEEGMTCVLVTHQMRFAREVSDQVCFTDAGVIIEAGPPDALFDHPQEARTREFLAKVL